jgi:TnpA family transposase
MFNACWYHSLSNQRPSTSSLLNFQSFKRQHKTRRALEEYDHIIRSLYLLDYVDSLSLRHNVQRAVNRGDSYHQLWQAVAYANLGKLRFRSEYEQNLWQVAP